MEGKDKEAPSPNLVSSFHTMFSFSRALLTVPGAKGQIRKALEVTAANEGDRVLGLLE